MTKTMPTEAERFIESLPVQKHYKTPKRAMTLKDFIDAEPESDDPPGESPTLRATLTAMTWIGFALAVGAAVWLTATAGDNITQYVAP
jgi:hypothetical protein